MIWYVNIITKIGGRSNSSIDGIRQLSLKTCIISAILGLREGLSSPSVGFNDLKVVACVGFIFML